MTDHLIPDDIKRLQKFINSGLLWFAPVEPVVADKVANALRDGLVLLPRSGSHYILPNGEQAINRDKTLGPGSYSYVKGIRGYAYADALDEIGEDFLE